MHNPSPTPHMTPSPTLRGGLAGLLLAALVAVSGCAAVGGPSTTAAETEGLLVAVVEGANATFTVSVRDVAKPAAGASSLDAVSRYQLAANRAMAGRCGPTRQPELQTETSRQGVDGRDYSFRCALVSLNRAAP